MYILVANLLLLLSNMPMAVYVSKSVPKKVFQFVHPEWIHDYYSYLAYITQGKEGLWLKKSPYSTEPQTPGIFHIYFPLAGKLGAIFDLDPVLNYHLARLMTAQLYLLAVYLFARVVLDKKLSFMGAVFILIGTVAPPFLFKTKIWTDNYPFGNPYWENFDALQRLYGLPHHLFGQAAATLSIACFFLYVNRKKIVLLFAAIVTAFVAAIIFPPMLLPLVFGLSLSWILYFILTYLKTHVITKDFKVLPALFIYFITLTAAFIILRFQENQGYPWSQTRSWELIRWNMNEPYMNQTIFFLFGILPLLALPSAIYNIIKRNWGLTFTAVWGYMPLLLLPFADIMSLPKIRLPQLNPYIPLGILCADTIFRVVPKLKIKPLKSLFLALFLITNLAVVTQLFILRYHSIDIYSNYRFDTVYLPDPIYESLRFIQSTVPKNSVFLSTPRVGLMIPAYSLNTSFIGHLIDTYHYAQKEIEMKKFYANGMTFDEAELFVKNSGIDYVYFGPSEKYYASRLNYPFLKEYYSKDEVQIYRVN